jgi:Uma2 family endonuclease
MATTATMSGAQFDALPYEEGRRWELLSGDLIDVSSPTPEHQLIVSNLNASLRNYFRQRAIGGSLPDVEFALGGDDRLRPDIAILLHDRWQNLDRRITPVPGSPSIAVEVISPGERAADSTRKTWTYLKSGVEEVWHILPKTRAIMTYTSHSGMSVIGADGDLRSPLLPGWQISVDELFDF